MADLSIPVLEDYKRLLRHGFAAGGPQRLWHYTTSEGLLGIVNSGAIWATNSSYLNDRSELRYTLDQVKEACFAAFDGLLHPSALDEFLDRSFSDEPLRSIMVACFCASGDLLSQWRGYSTPGGFALGFDRKKLIDYVTTETQTGILAPVDYDAAAATRAAQEWAERVRLAWDKKFPDGLERPAPLTEEDWVEKVAKSMYNLSMEMVHLRWMAAFYKNPSFSEEEEWRLARIGRLGGGEEFDRHFRVGRQGLVPYIRVPFQASPESSPIAAIQIGPGLDFATQEAAIRSLLQATGYPEAIEISPSDVPFRS